MIHADSVKAWEAETEYHREIIRKCHAEIERLRAALQKIIDEADSNDGLTAWDGADIARAALANG